MVQRVSKARTFAVNEIYHVYNRGVEKRNITEDIYDSQRFLESLVLFNVQEPIGSIYQQSFSGSKRKLSAPRAQSPLVKIIAYCLNPNHYHLLVEPLSEKGLSLFMQKLGAGYTLYFNGKHKRTGALFQGRFKARHIATNGDLQQMGAYVNLNNKVHQLSAPRAKLVRSSMGEYVGNNESRVSLCSTAIIRNSFQSGSAYKQFAEDTVKNIVQERLLSNDDAYKKELYGCYFE